MPRPAPNTNKVAISNGMEPAVARSGSARQISKVPPIVTRRQPKRVASRPAMGIAMNRARAQAQQQQAKGALHRARPWALA